MSSAPDVSARAPATPTGPSRQGWADEGEVDRFLEMLARFERGDVGADEWRGFRLVHGVYSQRQEGVNMLRAKIPGGILNPKQLTALADVAERWAGGDIGHVTTRQNIQFHFVPEDRVEDAMRHLADAGITTREACGHSVRNWTACPFAGVSPTEPFDVTPYLEALARHLLRGPNSATLPRKFKASVGGCCEGDCSLAAINDLGYLAEVRDGVRGFRVVTGGGLSNLPRSAFLLEEWVPAGEILDIADAVVRVFNRIGDRENRNKARLRWAIRRIGKDAFLALYRSERDQIRREGGVRLVLPAQPTAPGPVPPPLAAVRTPLAGYEAWARDAVRHQRQNGYATVVLRLLLGDISARQLRGLARLAPEFGEGEVRTTIDQNLVLRYVPAWRLSALHRELDALGLARAGAGTIADVTSCPGASTCRLAVTASRGLAATLTEFLDARPEVAAQARGLDIKISGCPSSCGQHQVAGIGFQGGARKVNGRVAPQYLVYLGGGDGGARLGRIAARIPARRVPEALERLLALYTANGDPGEAPDAFFARVSQDLVRATLRDLTRLSAEQAREEDFVDLGNDERFEVLLQQGECAA